MTSPADPRVQLRSILQTALEAVDAGAAVNRCIQLDGSRLSICEREVPSETRLVVVALGKAAAPMAASVVARVPPARIRSGLVVTKDHHAEGHDLGRFEVYEAGHPVPDNRSATAAERLIESVADAGPDDLLLVLLSGGASALVSLPPREISGDELARTNQLLLASGADIAELNAVRKHLSRISGGRLAQITNASRTVVLAVSDVMGDPLDVIGSGPFAPDPSRFADALEILERRGLAEQVPENVLRVLERGRDGGLLETPKPGDPVFERVEHRIVARNADARQAAEAAGRATGARAIALEECIFDESSRVGCRLAALTAAIACDEPVLLVAGGESVVHVRGTGRGGRNQELALAAAIELDRCGHSQAVLLAAGTDGTDGPTDAAGAWADSGTVTRGRREGADAGLALENNDAYTFFAAESGLVMTGPTGTNVMDLVLIWVPPEN